MHRIKSKAITLLAWLIALGVFGTCQYGEYQIYKTSHPQGGCVGYVLHSLGD